MLMRRLLVFAVFALSVATCALVWGLFAGWSTGNVVTSIVAAACGLVAAGLAAAILVRRALRLLQSTQKYARLSSERTAAMRSSLSAKSSPSAKSERRPDRPSTGTSVVARPGGPTIVLALGKTGDDPGLMGFLRDNERGAVVLVTDRADLVPQLARGIVVEYVPIPAAAGAAPIAWLATRLVELAVEHGAAAIVQWPSPERALRVSGNGIESLSVLGEDVVRALLGGDVRPGAAAPAAEPEQTRVIADRLTKSTSQIKDAVERLDRRSEKRHEATNRKVRAALDDVYRQLESLTILYRVLDDAPTLPHLRGWAASPDLAADLLDLVVSGRSRTILELGSGASTVIFALALDRVGDGHVTSIDHDESYAAQTRAMLERYGVSHRATVLHTPLVPMTLDGDDFSWYGLDGVELPAGVDLLFVDGPPEATGPRSRYPALPLLEAVLADEACIVLDDGQRPDEQAIAAAWAAREGIVRSTMLPHERRPIMLEFRRPQDLDPARERPDSEA